MNENWIKGKKVTVMGLGLHGGGLEVCRFLCKKGALVTATDLRTAEILAPSLEKLKDYPVKFVLGEHRMEDFTEAYMVIKNPAVPSESPYLKAAQRIETDLSLFLQFSNNPILAITGSKGKSTIVTALHHILKAAYPDCRLGGNITVSPLSFLHELKGDEPVILELSSWQLGDLRGRDLLKPEISLITNIMHDHQNRYNSIAEYIEDKEEVFLNQNEGQMTLLPYNDLGFKWEKKTKAQVKFFCIENKDCANEALFYIKNGRGFCNLTGNPEEILPLKLNVPGDHFRGNMLLAAATAILYGMNPQVVKERLETFEGVPHRMEKIRIWKGITFYNDTAATIPDATMAALNSFDKPPLLICGGTDKELDMSPLEELNKRASRIFLLKGSGTERMIPYIEKSHCPYSGPYETLKEAFDGAVRKAKKGDRIILSPGATSFGMFLNEFDRGDQFRDLVKDLP